MSLEFLFAISDTGGGHRSAAVAIGAALDHATGGTASHTIVDVLRASGVPGVRDAPSLYDILSTRWLRFYDFSFNLTNSAWRVDMITRLVWLRARRSITYELRNAQPQVVVVTHPLVNRLVCIARRAYRLPFRVITVVTDLVTLHASWTYRGVDLALAPTDEAYALMTSRGMRTERLLRTGFPVHPKFAEAANDQHSMRQRLGLAQDRFTVLVTGGGVGSGQLGALVRTLAAQLPQHQVLVVTGKNRALYDELKAHCRSPYFHIYGFVNNMEELMVASDVVITKAGPGTLMEALVMRRPVLVTEAVGMQERGNIDFVLNRDIGRFCPTADRIIDAVTELSNPQVYAATQSRLADAVPRNGSAQIAQILLDQLAIAKQQLYGEGRNEGRGRRRRRG